MFGCRAAEAPRALPGAAWPGLSTAQLEEFEQGRELFHREFTEADGLGPVFNQARCSSCHDLPTLGGAGVEHVRKATRFQDGQCDLLHDAGGEVFQARATEALKKMGWEAERVAQRANTIVLMSPPPLYGLGAIEAIADAEILSRADPDDADGDGISGRAGRTADGRVARFGRKATVGTVQEFVERAFADEMGLTTGALPQEESIAGRPVPDGADPARDPEVDSMMLARVTHFVQMLAFPLGDSTLTRDSTAAGAKLFERIGCASCHTPTLRAGPSSVAGLARARVPLYSDLLLHDLGPGLASVCAPGVEPGEWRTSPLVGLRLRLQFLHDGRAQAAERAIQMHGGEAKASRQRYDRLSPEQQAALLRFLRSL